ncbi:polyprenyl synthetase family protein [bacterium]|jgi:geranylgeranyl diphosphate synthase, type II|nr:polyprenyl synthetase family protein [bacterium]
MPTSAEPFSQSLAAWRELVDRSLEHYVGANLAGPDRLTEAIRYSLFAGGKRLRPILVLLSCEACGGLADAAIPAACAVEMVHTYSLIHDDLPAMDDDEYRRGQLTCHRKFNEATAILAGDALHTLAFEVLTELQPSATAIRCVRELAASAGPAGMVGGQMDDLHPPTTRVGVEWLSSLHSRKTGALLAASLRMGGIIGGGTDAQLDSLLTYGQAIGLAFQIADDVLDVEGDPKRMGKGVQKDSAAGKLTYPHLLGVEESRQKATEMVEQAIEALATFGKNASMLKSLARYVVERDR